ncbi:leucyl aminopeptidase family protein [Chelatococcus sp. SYSU_G07232]|uniref:Leucyl aminopeptidase family protein n=1 Tax=Chelatococcus albus TaxID=3047466 RepID=A0ABT7ADZ7_9HYPH|nr:leucyl aminopeptidase family protein [Chelatococcus sp. SYSU_G07232]MDJ1157611.1 leucyl aminopeptidase family protein [Chelatococcus sp. SYSU_G07232]
MHPLLVNDPSAPAIPVHFTTAETWADISERLSPLARGFAGAQNFEPAAGKHLLLPDAGGGIAGVVFCLDNADARHPDPFLPGKLPTLLPDGTYRFADGLPDVTLATLAFLLGAYRFDRYRKPKTVGVKLVLPPGVDGLEVSRLAEAVTLGRDLVNTPTNDLGPDGIETAARNLAARHGAEVSAIVGDALIAKNFPMIHAVGRASAVPPRLVDVTWGEPSHPKVTIVGKGVAFDTGGLNIKPESAMALMKKDMGGSAAALALAHLVMDAQLPVRLRVLIPAVENAISGSSYRPGDVLRSRKGLSVEISNTDAEGRLVLADALALADEEAPDLIVDYATLTGAARVALGPDLPPFYTQDETIADDLARLSRAVNDPVWRLPLWAPYDSMLDSKIADVNHTSGGPFAGSVTAALFLHRFVEKARAYVHFDIFAWNPSTKPGRPEGGEVQAARLVYALLKQRYGTAA